MAKSKQYNDNAKKYDRDALHSDAEAIAIIKSLGPGTIGGIGRAVCLLGRHRTTLALQDGDVATVAL